MAVQKKCVICGEPILTTDETIPYKSRTSHMKCFQIAIKTIKKDKDEKLKDSLKNTKSNKNSTKSKPKVELKDPLSEEDYQEKKAFYDYLRQFFDEGQIPSQVYAMVENQIKKYNFTFRNMYNTLIYIHEILEKELNNDIVGIIPYFYTIAQNYFKSIEQVEEANKNIDVSKMYKEKVVVIQPKKRITKQLDIESIGKGEDNGS